MSTYTEDHLVEKPAIQLMQHEMGWDVGGNIEHRTPNIEHRSEEKRKKRTHPALQRLNPDLPVEAVEGAVEEREILDGEFWILNGRERRPALQRLNPDLPVEAIEGAVEERLGARRSGNGLRRDATATFCWTIGSICALRDSDILCNWNL